MQRTDGHMAKRTVHSWWKLTQFITVAQKLFRGITVSTLMNDSSAGTLRTFENKSKCWTWHEEITNKQATRTIASYEGLSRTKENARRPVSVETGNAKISMRTLWATKNKSFGVLNTVPTSMTGYGSCETVLVRYCTLETVMVNHCPSNKLFFLEKL